MNVKARCALNEEYQRYPEGFCAVEVDDIVKNLKKAIDVLFPDGDTDISIGIFADETRLLKKFDLTQVLCGC